MFEKKTGLVRKFYGRPNLAFLPFLEVLLGFLIADTNVMVQNWEH
jgi:hypothetical protein